MKLHLKTLPFLLWVPLLTHAQTTDRTRRAVAGQPEVQLEVAPDARSLLYLGLGGLRYGDAGPRADRSLGLDVRYLAAGFERQFENEQWSWGATLRLATAVGVPTGVQPGLLLRHRAALGPLLLGQRLGLEYALNDPTRFDPAYNFLGVSPALVRLRLDLRPRQALALGGLTLSPGLSFEPALFLRLQRDAADPDKRTIDFTSLRAEVNVGGGKGPSGFTLTPWFGLQTQYLRTLIQFDPQGRPTSNGKANVLLPTAGLEVRYRLRRAGEAESDFRLPTHH